MAEPWDYAKAYYLNLSAKLEDGSLSVVKIDRYLNNGLLKAKRTLDAGKEKDRLLAAIANELKVKGSPPLQFEINGVTINRLELQRVFTGKGAPANIRTAIWLASRYKRTDSKTVADYCNRYIGLDCNGFAGNFWGIDPDTWIGAYDKKRRKEVADVTAGDAMMFYLKGASSPYHIAVVEEVKVHKTQFEIVVVQSMGLDVGIHLFSWGVMTPQKNAKGELFTQKVISGAGDTTMYFAAGPEKGKSAT